jgi:hypothetical protein
VTDLEAVQGHLLPPEEVMMPLYRGPLGEWKLVSPVGRVFVPQPLLILMGSFLLSSVARYRPDIWSEVIAPRRSSSGVGLRAVIEDFYGIALRRFALDALAAILAIDLAVFDRGPVLVTS